MIYYPEHLKFVDVGTEEHEPLLPRRSSKERLKSAEWRLSIFAAWIVGIHLYVPSFFYVITLNIAFALASPLP